MLTQNPLLNLGNYAPGNSCNYDDLGAHRATGGWQNGRAVGTVFIQKQFLCCLSLSIIIQQSPFFSNVDEKSADIDHDPNAALGILACD